MNVTEYLKKYAVSFSRPYPARDWLLSLGVAFLVFLALVTYAVNLYFGIQSGTLSAPQNVSASAPPAVNRADIETLLQTYQARNLNYTAHNLPLSPVVDPAPPFSAGKNTTSSK